MKVNDIMKILREHKEVLKRYGVKRIGVFGSAVRGELGEESDIDFIFEFEEGKKNFDNFIELAFFLEGIFGRKVDLLAREGISGFIKPYVEREVCYA